METKEVRYINFLDQDARKGHYSLLKIFDDMAVVSYSSCNEAPRCYLLIFENLQAEKVGEVKVEAKLLDQVHLGDELKSKVDSIKKEYVTLDNGAEGYFVRMHQETPALSDGKLPMITLIHGGPFSASP